MRRAASHGSPELSQDVRDYAAAISVILREVELGYLPDQREPHVGATQTSWWADA